MQTMEQQSACRMLIA